MNVDLKCKICNEECPNIKSLIGHVRIHHGMESKEYYDKYYKQETDGICETCGRPTKFYRISQGGYFRFCSKKCSNMSPLTQARKAETNIEKYGTRVSSQNTAVKEKARQTCLEKYGTASSAQSETVKETVRRNSMEKYGTDSVNRLEWKIRKTKDNNLEKYGVESNFQLESNKEKSRRTCLDRYGVDIASKCDEVKEKMRQTNMERYGTDWTVQNDDIRNSIKQTLTERYGVDNPMQCTEIQERAKATSRERYGTDFAMQNPYIAEKVKEARRLNIEKEYLEKYNFVIRYDDLITCHCDKCRQDYKITKSMFHNRIRQNTELCTICMPLNAHISTGEKELVDYIKSIYAGPIVENDRTVLNGKELDIYLPEKRLAFEFDGLYWHNELNKPDDYHLRKTEACEAKGVRLVHVFEDEWVYRQDIVRSVISGMFGLNEKIYARKCEIREVSPEGATAFLEKNHLQGAVNSKWRYGLYYGNEPVSLMTFGRSRFGKGTELHRYCCRVGTNVVGGASKLFNYFTGMHPEIDEIVTFADRRVFTGGMYSELGFRFDGYTPPSYFYVVDGTRRNRMEFQKHRLVKEGYDPSMTEHEIMLSRGIFRIYDCGNSRYVINKI